MSGTDAIKRLSRREAFVAWFQYAGLWALVIAWPVYQNIASGPEALTGVGARRLDLVVIIAVVSLLAPTVLALVEILLARFIPGRAAPGFRGVVLGSFFGIFAWQYFTSSGIGDPLRQLVPVLIWAGASYLYLRSDFFRNFAGILGLATPVVIVAFCLRYPISSEVLPHDKPEPVAKFRSDTPVVMVVLDELPLASLENQAGRIDSRLFPAFGKLAATSTWYPGMTAVADQTAEAVPAILSGRAPEDLPGDEPLPPGLPSYPDNVCSVARSGGYSVFAYEPVTDLCHRTYGLGTRVSTIVQRGIVSGEDLFPTSVESRGANALTKPFRTPWTEYDHDRDNAVDDFIQKMPGTDRSLSVLHIALPHVLWQYLPDGRTYTPDSLEGAADIVPGTLPEADHFLQQMLLQLAYTDSRLAQIIKRMKSQGIWNKSLFVVTADHGASFKPGTNRRVLAENNLGWILPIPLLIKYPGQKTRRVVSGDANLTDITPTILHVLGANAPGKASGISLQRRRSLPDARRLKAQGYGGRMEPDRQRVRSEFRRARKQRNALFSHGTVFDLGGHRGLLGRKPGEAGGLIPLPATISDPGQYKNVDTSSNTLPAYLRAVLNPKDGEDPGDLAVALNGRIVATARSWPYYTAWVTAINLPDQSFRTGTNRISFYSIPRR